MKIPFTKMHGIGNDYIYVNCLEKELQSPGKISEKMSPRHFSIGADGLVMICASDVADAKMRMFNADGSEGKMCGNAIRCVAKYLYDNDICKKTNISIETLSGIKYLSLNLKNGKVDTVRVDMGIAVTSPESIPVKSDKPMINEGLEVDGKQYSITAVSMGNPHAVIFTDTPVDTIDLESIGPKFENHPLFPERVNTEFVNVISPTILKMRVWERGSGETFACGTGACATVVAAVINAISPIDTEITVKLRGGDLKIMCTSDMRIFMTGKAEKSYDGVYEYEDQGE